jgi:hypothetical protein
MADRFHPGHASFVKVGLPPEAEPYREASEPIRIP